MFHFVGLKSKKNKSMRLENKSVKKPEKISRKKLGTV